MGLRHRDDHGHVEHHTLQLTPTGHADYEHLPCAPMHAAMLPTSDEGRQR